MVSTSKKQSQLLLESSDSDNDGTGADTKQSYGLTVNKDYAERYNKWRLKEEVQKSKDRGEDLSEEESSSSSEEEWTGDHEKAFLTALSSLKGKDPVIYDGARKFFSVTETSEVSSGKKNKSEKSKPFLIKDHERKMIMEHNGASDSEEQDQTPQSASYYEEQHAIKKDLKFALGDVDSDDEKDSVMFKKRVKSDTEVYQEEEDYRKWLRGELTKLNEKGKEEELKFLRDYWNDPKLDDGEQFLRDYILERKYVEKEEKDHTPSYDEIVHDSDEGGLSGDEKQLEEMELFENKYNFRFEEPDPEFIKKYPRTIDESYRRKEMKRKKDREKVKNRKQEEKERKVAELQQLKALKRKEILDKIEKLQEVAGDADLPFANADLEGDFNPVEYDRRMSSIFNQDYYEEADNTKPVFAYDERIDDEEDWQDWFPTDDEVNITEMGDRKKQRNKKNQKGSTKEALEGGQIPKDDESVVEEQKKHTTKKKRRRSSIDRTEEEASASKVIDTKTLLMEASKGKRMSKRKSIFLDALEKKKPKFDPLKHQSFEKYFDEYYKLDFEDIVDDIPCRFKYRTVVPNDFGLSIGEILEADDKELNQWASLKKTYQYRTVEEEKFEVQAYLKKATNSKAKSQILVSLNTKNRPDSCNTSTFMEEDTNSGEPSTLANSSTKTLKKKKKKKKKKSVATTQQLQLDIAVSEAAQLILQEPNPDIVTKRKWERKKELETEKSPAISGAQAKKQVFRQNKSTSTTKKTRSISEDRLRAYGINPIKYEKRKKFAKN